MEKKNYSWTRGFLLRKHTKTEGIILILMGLYIIYMLGLPKFTSASLFIVAGVCFAMFLISYILSIFLEDICFPDFAISQEDTKRAFSQLREELTSYEERYERDSKFFIAVAFLTGIIGLAIIRPYSWVSIPAIVGMVISIYIIKVKISSTVPEPTAKNIAGMASCGFLSGLTAMYKNVLSETEPLSIAIQGTCFLTVALAALYYIKKTIDEYKKEKRFNNTCEDLLCYSLLRIGLIVWNILFHCILKL